MSEQTDTIPEAGVETIMEWLGTKGVTLWQSWEIISESSRRKAAEWFYSAMSDYAEYLNSHDQPGA